LEVSALNLGQTFVHAEDIRILHIDCSTDILLPSNFPFNSPGAIKYASSLDEVRNLIYSHRDKCDAFVEAYLALYQPVHPILDPPRFLKEINYFWEDAAQTDVSWLSTYLMVLALGCFAVTRDSPSTIELCLAAESCLARTTFMVRPSMSVMRTFCLIVLAKQLANGTCWSFDASWSLLGIIVRLAVCIGLHKPPVASSKPMDSHAVTVSEWQTGHILWITIVYFCIQTAAITGMPSLLSSDDILRRTETHDALLPHIEPKFGPWLSLSDSFPTICSLIARVNSDTEKPTYDEILRYNADIKLLMATTLEHPGCRNPSLRAVLDIFFRRILLVLHRCHALRPDAPILHPVSYWASLECSLAILVHHRDLCEHVGNPDNRDLLGRFFKLDFFAAALTAGLHLLQADAPLADGFSIPPRQTILETLETCTEIWGRDKERSVCFRSGHRSLMQILSMLSDLDAMRRELPHR
ncbi:putative fungal-specific transcription factor, partial [Trichoderma reesei RUT C-30]